MLFRSALATGLKLYISSSKDGSRTMSHDEVVSLMKTTHYRLTKTVEAFISSCQGRAHMHIWRSPVHAAMFASFAKNATAAKDFWTAVRDGTMLAAEDPRLKLNRMLLSNLVCSGTHSRQRAVSAEDMYRW